MAVSKRGCLGEVRCENYFLFFGLDDWAGYNIVKYKIIIGEK